MISRMSSRSDTVRPVLEAINIEKAFGGVCALKGVSLSLFGGQVHALVGENGAGKSTLIKILTGALRADAGEIFLRGIRLEHASPSSTRALGISVIYQEPALFPDLTVAENIAIARGVGHPWQRINHRAQQRRAADLLAGVGANIQPHTIAGKLTMAQQQLVEIAKALDSSASVVIMDEPTASLGDQDAENLFRLITDMRAAGTAILYISHRFQELFRLADQVTILRDGEVVETRPMEGTTKNQLIRLMVGRELQSAYPRHDVQPGPVAFEVCNLTSESAGVFDVSLSVRKGEILGLAGLVGAGRTQLAEALFGLVPVTSGEVRLADRPVVIRSPPDAVREGLAYVPEDRRRHGVILAMSIVMNATLASLRSFSQQGFLKRRAEHAAALHLSSRLQVKAPSIQTLAKHLSGGNQQKVALARWLMTSPKVLILDEPTQGIDIGARAEIYHLIGELARQGLAILMISSDMSEILGLSDRIAVMVKGRITGFLNRNEATAYKVLELALGHKYEENRAIE
jgi:rhamnose transport system ATP-binding protein